MSEKSAGVRDHSVPDDNYGGTRRISQVPVTSPCCLRCLLFDWLSAESSSVAAPSPPPSPLAALPIKNGDGGGDDGRPKNNSNVVSPHPMQRVPVISDSENRLLFTSSHPFDAFSPQKEDDQRRRRRRRLKLPEQHVAPEGDDNRSSSTNYASSCSSSSSINSPPRRLSLLSSLLNLAGHCRTRILHHSVIVTTKNTFLLTTFYILSVFLFLSGFLPVCVAKDSNLLMTTARSSPSLNLQFYPQRRRNHRDVSTVQQQMPIFRSAEYIFGAAPATSNVYDLPGDNEAPGGNPNSGNLQRQQDQHDKNASAVRNATTVYVKEPPVVWVPYLGVVVIIGVFTVLITTFWLHIRHSRYRAIQLVKSSPNSEWNEIQPGRWEASYGGHIYTVNQINQTRVLGAIAAATAVAMGEGVKHAISRDRVAPIGEGGDSSQVQESSTTVAEVEEGERTGLLISPAEAGPPTAGRNSNNTSVVATSTPATRTVSGPITAMTPVPVSDSIWLLTEEQLMDSIRSSNGSHKSTPTPTPTTTTTATGDGISTSTVGSITSATRRSNVPPPIPPRTGYGTFSPTGGPKSPPTTIPHEAVAKLAMVERKVTPLNSGEIALEPMMLTTTTPFASDASNIKQLLQQEDQQEDQQNDLLTESEDVCGELPMPVQAMSSLASSFEHPTAGGYSAAGWNNDSFCSEPGDESNTLSPIRLLTQQLSLDEMTLPEPEPWTPHANAVFPGGVPGAPKKFQGNFQGTFQGRMPVITRASIATGNPAAGASLQQTPSVPISGQSTLTTTNLIQGGRRAVRGSVRGRGRGAAGRGQLSSLIAYSNMSKKKGSGFIIPH